VRKSMSCRNKYRDFGTFIFNKFFYLTTNIQTEKQNVYYRLISRDLATRLLGNNRWKHFLRIDYSSLPEAATTYINYDGAERLRGKSKYNLKRLIAFSMIAILSAVSVARFTVMMAVGVLVSALFAALHWYVPSLLLLGVIGAVLVKFLKMSRYNVIDAMEIEESSPSAPQSAPISAEQRYSIAV